MGTFTIYHSLNEAFPGYKENLASLVREVIEPDGIFLLGACEHQRRSESIFCDTAPAASYLSDYFLLILVPRVEGRNPGELQDKIEQHCRTCMRVITIVIETNAFTSWLKTGHRFARRVHHASVKLYDKGISYLPLPEDHDAVMEQKDIKKYFQEGLGKMREFLVGVDLFRIREQSKMAAFMLHQAAEQGLRTILKTGTGYYSCTHNLERLLWYASMVSYKLPDIFSAESEKDKQLLKLLQKAYVGARYNEDYIIHVAEINSLVEKITRIQEILEATGKTYISAEEHKNV